MVIKAVIFDIGGVVVGSPVVGVTEYEQALNLPPHYLNNAITARGAQGAFQQLERNEIKMEEFLKRFGEELSDVEVGNKAYKAFCKRRGVECPPLPKEPLGIAGDHLWTKMMAQTGECDENILLAINHLRQNPLLKLAALTNNFVESEVTSTATSALQSSSSAPAPRPRSEIVTGAMIHDAFEAAKAATGVESSGLGGGMLKSLFDEYFESAKIGMRKPDPKFYQYALDHLGIKGEEAAFLDDIGQYVLRYDINLDAARKLGIHTIRVLPGRSMDAVLQLEKLVGMDLHSPLPSPSAKL